MQRTMLRIGLLLGLACLFLSAAGSASAGGWAVITLTHLPDYAVAGQPAGFEFVIRQHGRTPWVSDMVLVKAIRVGSSDALTGKAESVSGTPGTYRVQITFPAAGLWRWSVSSGLYPDFQPMPDLTVVAAAASTAGAPLPNRAALLSGAAGLAGALLFAVLLILRRSRARQAAALSLVCLALGLAGFSLAADPGQPAQSTAAIPAYTPAPLSQAALGERLFIAKGCIVCHSKTASGLPVNVSLDMGPNLTKVDKDAQYLKYWLADPSELKPETTMPKLGLSGEEIQALIAFLKAGN